MAGTKRTHEALEETRDEQDEEFKCPICLDDFRGDILQCRTGFFCASLNKILYIRFVATVRSIGFCGMIVVSCANNAPKPTAKVALWLLRSW